MGIEFEDREFVWHPRIEHEDELGRSQYGPMVAVVVTGDADRAPAAQSLQRFLSAVAFEYDQPLRRALSYYREGANTTSPFYGCVVFRNVLDLVYNVEHETRQRKPTRKPTQEAAARDEFINSTAALFTHSDSPSWEGTCAHYLREGVRNALAHVLRPGRHQVSPDDPWERVRLSDVECLLRRLAKTAVEQHWPYGVSVSRASNRLI